jgi:hypothetical protein
MDPDLVRQQEEAEREAAGLPPKKPVNVTPAPIQSRHAPSVEQPLSSGLDSATGEKSGVKPKQSIGPNGAAPSSRWVHGLRGLLLYAAIGAAVGAILGFVATTYFDVFKTQPEFFISRMAEGFALLFGLTQLLYYNHS